MDRTTDGSTACARETTSTRRTVLTAGAANVLVAIVKLAAGILVGSTAAHAAGLRSLASMEWIPRMALISAWPSGSRDDRTAFRPTLISSVC
jgi:hypothetical protein